MNENDFKTASLLLAQEIAPITQAKYEEKIFGSWYVELATQPPLRLIWDGRDGWLRIERHTDKKFNDLDVWDEIWVDEKPKDNQTAIQKALVEMKRANSGTV